MGTSSNQLRWLDNTKEIFLQPIKKIPLELIHEGIVATHPETLVKNNLTTGEDFIRWGEKKFELNQGKLFLIGLGKSSIPFIESALLVFKNSRFKPIETIVVSNENKPIPGTKHFTAEHPVPGNGSLAASEYLLGLSSQYQLTEDDTLLFFISGGTSSLISAPAEGILPDEKRKMMKLLLHSGADINQINIVRKHISSIKGGKLAEKLYPAKLIGLMLSDVPDDNPSSIGSGPITPDSSTFEQAWKIIESFDLVEKTPDSIHQYLKKGMKNKTMETPEALNNTYSILIGSKLTSLEAMKKKAMSLGFSVFRGENLRGDPESAVKRAAKDVAKMMSNGIEILICGGETTPTVPDEHGEGGRNRHFVLRMAWEMLALPGDWVICSAGTDGVDYTPGVGGGIISRADFETILKNDWDVTGELQRFDSGGLLKNFPGTQIHMQPTGVNVADLAVIYYQGNK